MHNKYISSFMTLHEHVEIQNLSDDTNQSKCV